MAIITGTAGDDQLNGGTDDDTIDGLDGNDTLFGGGGLDIMFGGLGNDNLDGGTGADTMTGGLGDDRYVVDDILDSVTELVGEGQDTVISFIDYTLGANVELLYLTSGGAAVSGTGNELDNEIGGNALNNILSGMDGNDTIFGLAGNDQLIGGLGADRLDGGAGADTMVGGQDGDRYVVDDALDVVTELADQGVDTVVTSINYTLGANVELLYLTSGSVAVSGTGNGLDNEIGGNELNNILSGQGGLDTLYGEGGDDLLDGGALKDRLHGGTGNDMLVGGLGDDHYYFNIGDGVDTITDVSVLGEGSVFSPLSNALVFGPGITVNDLTLGFAGGSMQIHVGTTGDRINLSGFNPNDVYGVHAIQSYHFIGSLFPLFYHELIDSLGFTIKGTANADDLTGTNAVDHMFGYAGDDTYEVSTGDTVVEAANEGTDLVLSNVTFTLGANVEHLTLTGAGAINGTGNSLNNVLTGNSAANVLTGGAGDDTYFVSTGDTVVEQAAEGADLVYSDVTWTLGANLERLTLIGTAAINGTGNELNNTLIGNSAANLFTGGAGDDTYAVSTGDQVVEQANEGVDLVLSGVSFTLGAHLEKLALTGTSAIDGAGNGLANVLTGNNGVNVLAGGTGDDTYGVSTGDTVVETVNAGNDLVLSNVSWTLGANLERLTLTGTEAIDGTGNELKNTLIGNSVANVLTGLAGDDLFNGGAGADTLAGGTGNDIYYAGVDDTMVEAANEGTDLVLSDISWTLDQNIEKLALFGTGAINGTGNSLNNTLTGNSAANVLAGGAGDDTYGVAVGDTVVEAANEGIDLVLSNVGFTLGANLENLTLTENAANGTGNALNNILTGNSGANVLTGGAGDDTYIVSVGDTVVEAANEGTDLVLSSVTWTLGANLEKLTLTGAGVINGTGNSLNNTFLGNSAANVFTGGAGDDTYGVGTGDTVVEQLNAGTDTVLSGLTWTLGTNIERLTLTGTGAIDGTGNSLNNTLVGNSAANVLTGGAGNDTLAGGLGNDTYGVDRGEGQDAISENDGTGGNSDLLLYGATINPLDLVLSRQVNDLRIAIHGSTDQVTVQNWYSAPTTAQVETIQAGNGQTLLSTQVDQLIQAMATFSANNGGITWDQALDQQPQNVQTVLAASWQ